MAQNLKLLSWNVNGIRAVCRKDFLPFLKKGEYDVMAIQETKVSHPDLLSEEILHPDGYNSFFQYHDTKKGYSGVAIYTKEIPHKVVTEFENSILHEEGRVIELHFKNYILLNIYFPNGGRSEERLNYKLKFYKVFSDYVKSLKKAHKNIIFCGDVNTAHHEIDLARPENNINNSGFMPKERVWLDYFLELGFIDTFRFKNPKEVKYSWWDMKTKSRERNVGWRIDYFYVSDNLKNKIKKADVLTDILGSDHAPVYLELDL